MSGPCGLSDLGGQRGGAFYSRAIAPAGLGGSSDAASGPFAPCTTPPDPLLAFHKLRQAAALERGCMHEDVLAAVRDRHEAETLGGVVADFSTVPRFSTAASSSGATRQGRGTAGAPPALGQLTPDSPAPSSTASTSMTWRPFCPCPTLTRSKGLRCKLANTSKAFPAAPCRLQAPSTAFQTVGAAPP